MNSTLPNQHLFVSEFADLADIDYFHFLLTGTPERSPTELVISVPSYKISCQLPDQIRAAAKAVQENIQLRRLLRIAETYVVAGAESTPHHAEHNAFLSDLRAAIGGAL